MKFSKLLAFFALLALAASPLVVKGEEANFEDEESETKESDVHVLTKENFDAFVKENPVTLIEFYAPWCAHCKSLAPHYEEAATALKKAGGIPLAKVDAASETELATRFEIKGYPTLKLFRNGDPSEYTGGRTADTIVSWVESVTGPAVDVIEEKDAKAPSKGVLFIARVKKQDSAAAKLYGELAEKLRLSSKFALIVSDKAADEISVLRPDEDPSKTSIGTDQAVLEKWIEKERFPLFGPIDGENYAAYEAREQEIVWFAGKEEDYKEHAKEFRETSKKLREHYSFVWLDTEKYGSHSENGLGLTKLPGVVLRLREGGRYIYPDGKKYVSKELIEFFEDVKNGKVEKFLKSEPIPETNDEPVKVVVGKNFEDIVFRKDKDVMIEFYAPWCGHCKRLEPIYNEFAELLSEHDHIVIAKMDGTVNEAPNQDFTFRGFPTIFWVKAGETKPVTYNEARTLDGLLKYVKENSSKPVTVEITKVPSDEGEEGKDEL